MKRGKGMKFVGQRYVAGIGRICHPLERRLMHDGQHEKTDKENRPDHPFFQQEIRPERFRFPWKFGIIFWNIRFSFRRDP